MTSRYKILKLHRAANILGISGLLLSIPSSVFACVGGSFQRSTIPPLSIVSGLWWLIVWVVLIIARRRARLGEVFLILSSSLYFYLAIGSLFLLPYLVVAFILTASGILFIVSWRELKRNQGKLRALLKTPVDST